VSRLRRATASWYGKELLFDLFGVQEDLDDMPIYEYACDKCDSHLEVLQKMGDKPLTRCTKCRGKVRKVVSRSSFQLKGSGWYLTDYASKGGKKPESSESKSESKSAATACTPSGCGNCD
jgi:putative FmdB family regulatory protein